MHGLYADPALVDALVARFGPGVRARDGTVDRSALGRIALAEPGGMRDLERIVHPHVGARRERWLAAQEARVPPPPVTVCEVPLLFEVGLADRFDAVLVVSASDDVRRARVRARGQDFDALRARQMPEREKIARADRAYVNDGTPAELEAWVAARMAEHAGT